MLEITILGPERFDEENNFFIEPEKLATLRLEHSLVSISKWESKWHKAFLTNPNKTDEEILDYIRCMTITQNVNPEVYNFLSKENVDDITAYLNEPMTATCIPKNNKQSSNESITSELVYYWMIKFGIPTEFQKWHINRLLTLIDVCAVKEAPPKQMSRSEIMSRNRALNAQRKKQFNTKG